LKLREVKVGRQRAIQAVVSEPLEPVEVRRDPTGEAVVREVEPLQQPEAEEPLRYLPIEPVALEVQVPELRAAPDVGRDPAGQRVEAERQRSQHREVDCPEQKGRRVTRGLKYIYFD